jgi:hypothetical protein
MAREGRIEPRSRRTSAAAACDKAGVEERLVQFLRIEAALVVFRLLLVQQRLERCRARDQFRRREIGFRHRQNRARRSPFSETCRHLRFPLCRLCSPHAA